MSILSARPIRRGGVFLAIVIAGGLINQNLFDLHYWKVFVLTGWFVLLCFIAVG